MELTSFIPFFTMFDFSKVHSEPINSQFVLSRVSDAQIFAHYFGRFELGSVYPSIFRRDRNPSAGFYVGKTGKIIYNDFGTGERYDCFAFIARLNGISYGEAIKLAARDFGLIDPSTCRVSSGTLSMGAAVDKEAKKETVIQIIPDKWNDDNLGFWRVFEITKEELENEDVYPIKELYINKFRISNSNKYTRYAYLLREGDKEYLKIYSPFDKRMKWVSNIPLNIPFGLDKLSLKSDTLIITKSKKDLIVLKKIFPDVIATQNESESALSQELQDLLVRGYKKRVIFWDNDATGVANCKKFNSKGFSYFNIPKDYYERFGIKDASDFVAFYGVDALKELLQEKHLL